MNEYQKLAFADVGLSAWDAERLRGEHDCLSPGEGLSLLDVDERQRLMRAIAGAYASLYLRAPGRFLWLGFAALAVHDGVRPSCERAAEAGRSHWLEAIGRGAIGRTLKLVFGATAAAIANDGVKAAFETNYAIFADLYWVHLAYLDGGLPRLRELGVARKLADGFLRIDAGDVVDGNLLLFRREQQHVVTPVFAKYHHALAAATRFGLISVPNERLRASCAALRRSPDWSDAGASYGPFADRWRWLVDRTWEPFVRLHQEERAALHEEVWRVVTGA